MGRQDARVWGALLIVYVVWGSTYLAIFYAVETIPVFFSMAVRFLLAGALLYAFAIWRGDRKSDPIGRKQWLAAAIVGAFLFVGGNSLVAWAVTRVDTGVAALLIAAVPLWIALFDRAANGVRLTRPALLGLAGGFAGVALLAWPSGSGRLDVLGAVALIVSGIAWAIGSLYARRAALPRRPLVNSSMQMLTGGALLMLVAVGAGELGDVQMPSAKSLIAMAYLVVVGAVIAFSAFSWLIRTVPMSLASTYAYVNPVVAFFLGWAILDEPMSARTIVAGAIILGSVALIVTPSRELPRTAPAAVPARAQ